MMQALKQHWKQLTSRLKATLVTIIFGDYDDSAASAMDGALGRNNDIETQVA